MKKKVLILLMTVFVMLSLFTLTASAAVTVEEIEIVNLRTPLAGNHPDFSFEFNGDIEVAPAGSAFAAINGISWYRVDKKSAGSAEIEKQLKSTDTFELGKKYRARIFLKPVEGREWADTIVTTVKELDSLDAEPSKLELITPTGNGKTDHKVVVCTYECTMSAIDTVEITGLKLPEIGAKPDDDCNILTEGVYINSPDGKVEWSHNGITMDPATDTFEAGETYKLWLWLRTEFENGFYFKSDSLGENIAQVLVNGIPFEVCDTYEYDYIRNIEYEFYVPYNMVSRIGLVGVDKPVAGMVPDYDAAPTTAGYDIAEMYWSDVTEFNTLYDGGNGMSRAEAFEQAKLSEGDGKTFVAGHEYSVYFYVTAQQNYQISYDETDDYELLEYVATVNGKDAVQYSTHKDSPAEFSYNFGTPELQIIDELDVTDIDSPIAGNVPDYDGAVDSEGVDIVITWYDSTAEEVLREGDEKKFVAGHKYSVCVTATAKLAYAFKDDGDVLDADTYINSYVADSSSAYADSRELYFTYGFETIPYKGISEFTADGFDTPVAGKAVDLAGTVTGTGIQVTEIYWYDNTANVKLASADKTFTAGHLYKLVISVKTEDSYRFPIGDQLQLLNAKINGETAKVDVGVSGASALIHLEFAHTCSYDLVKKVEPTCIKEGKYAYYVCDCGKISEDAYGDKAIADVTAWGVIPATGVHTYSNACDKECNICKATRTVPAHKYTNSCDTTCNVCSAKRSITHTYSNACDKDCNICKATRKISHTYKDVTTKATLKKNGKVENKCSVCGNVSKTTTIYYPKTIKLSDTKYTYNGKAKKPSVTVKDSKGKALKKDTDYTVKYASGRKSTGKYTVTVTFKGKYSGTKKLTFNILPSKTSKITPTCDTTSIKASWKKVTGADGYKVELLNSKGKVVKTATTTKTAYTFKKLSKVTTYKVKVTAYKTIDKKKVYSTVSTTITTSTAPAKVTLSKVTAGKKQATPAWKTVKSASGYEVQYSTSSKFKSAKKATVKKGSTKKTTIKKLTKGKKYYFKVRAYKTVDGKKIYGAWSAAKSVKVK